MAAIQAVLCCCVAVLLLCCICWIGAVHGSAETRSGEDEEIQIQRYGYRDTATEIRCRDTDTDGMADGRWIPTMVDTVS